MSSVSRVLEQATCSLVPLVSTTGDSESIPGWWRGATLGAIYSIREKGSCGESIQAHPKDCGCTYISL